MIPFKNGFGQGGASSRPAGVLLRLFPPKLRTRFRRGGFKVEVQRVDECAYPRMNTSAGHRQLTGRIILRDAARAHRGVESMHWVFDVALHEDDCRVRMGVQSLRPAIRPLCLAYGSNLPVAWRPSPTIARCTPR